MYDRTYVLYLTRYQYQSTNIQLNKRAHQTTIEGKKIELNFSIQSDINQMMGVYGIMLISKMSKIYSIRSNIVRFVSPSQAKRSALVYLHRYNIHTYQAIYLNPRENMNSLDFSVHTDKNQTKCKGAILLRRKISQ